VEFDDDILVGAPRKPNIQNFRLTCVEVIYSRRLRERVKDIARIQRLRLGLTFPKLFEVNHPMISRALTLSAKYRGPQSLVAALSYFGAYFSVNVAIAGQISRRSLCALG
jgi:hypothetical protein